MEERVRADSGAEYVTPRKRFPLHDQPRRSGADQPRVEHPADARPAVLLAGAGSRGDPGGRGAG